MLLHVIVHVRRQEMEKELVMIGCVAVMSIRRGGATTHLLCRHLDLVCLLLCLLFDELDHLEGYVRRETGGKLVFPAGICSIFI